VAGCADLSFDIPADAPGTAGPVGTSGKRWNWALEFRPNPGGPDYREVFPIPIYDAVGSPRAAVIAERAKAPNGRLLPGLALTAIALFIAGGSRVFREPVATLLAWAHGANAAGSEVIRVLQGQSSVAHLWSTYGGGLVISIILAIGIWQIVAGLPRRLA
jgi:hypothetical protein